MGSKSKALSEFLSEAQEIVEAFGANLLRIDPASAEPDPELLNAVFRGAHSLKGLAGMFGVVRLSELAHQAEDLLDALRMGRAALDRDTVDLLLEFANVAQLIVAEVARGDDGTGQGGSAKQAEKMAARLAAAASPGSAPAQVDPVEALGIDASVRAVLTEYEEHRLQENVRKGLSVFRIRARFELADFDKGLGEINKRLKVAGEVVSTLPSPETGGAGISFDLLFGTRRSAEDVAALLHGVPAEVSQMNRAAGQAGPPQPVQVPAPPPRPEPRIERAQEAPAGPSGDLSLRSVSQTVRVDIHKLDRLMNVVGELVVSKTHLQRLTEALRGEKEQAHARALQTELAREERTLERKLNELQTGILEVRMVPLEQVFDKLARMVRKVAREAGKELDFLVNGGDVELDKLIVEELSDPLMHLIRNAIDHGVEAPEARERAGKARRGTVMLSASQKGNHVVIDISDDGAGIDDARVREVAIAQGLVTERGAQELSRRDLYNFLFMPGFSTARQVSELSGRGVGMDVVKTNIANLSGIIDVRSEKGAGTTFSITLPETLAILRALLVDAGGRTYAVPLNSVLEIFEVRPGEIETVEMREVVTLRGQSLPLVRLARLFQHQAASERGRLYVVVVGLAQERLGIAVDGLKGQQDIVIKPLGNVLGEVPGIAGATDLGNRRTVLVLDVGEIIEEVLSPDRAGERRVA